MPTETIIKLLLGIAVACGFAAFALIDPTPSKNEWRDGQLIIKNESKDTEFILTRGPGISERVTTYDYLGQSPPGLLYKLGLIDDITFLMGVQSQLFSLTAQEYRQVADLRSCPAGYLNEHVKLRMLIPATDTVRRQLTKKYPRGTEITVSGSELNYVSGHLGGAPFGGIGGNFKFFLVEALSAT